MKPTTRKIDQTLNFGGGPQLECAARVQYAAADLVADLSLDRVCLTGQRGFIQHCEASLDEAVDGQDLPR
jgi:hypothetical protein